MATTYPCSGCTKGSYPLVTPPFYGAGKDGWYDQFNKVGADALTQLVVFPQSDGTYRIRGRVKLDPAFPLAYTQAGNSTAGIISLTVVGGATISETTMATTSSRTRTATGGGTGTWTYTDEYVQYELTYTGTPPNDGTMAYITINYPALYPNISQAYRPIVAQIYSSYNCELKVAAPTSCFEVLWIAELNCPIDLCAPTEVGVYIYDTTLETNVLVGTIGQDGMLRVVNPDYGPNSPYAMTGFYNGNLPNVNSGNVPSYQVIVNVNGPGLPCTTQMTLIADGQPDTPFNGSSTGICTYVWASGSEDFDDVTAINQLVVNGVNVLTSPITGVANYAAVLAALNALNLGTFTQTGILTTEFTVSNTTNVFGPLTVTIAAAEETYTPTVTCI